MKVNSIMTAGVEVVSPDATIREAAQRLRSMNIGSLPVCNGERLVGYITDRDLTLRALAEGLDPSTPVRQCMSPEIHWCYEDEPLEEAERMMKEHQIRRLPVISREKRLVGILTLGDIAIKTENMREAGETLQEISELAPV